MSERSSPLLGFKVAFLGVSSVLLLLFVCVSQSLFIEIYFGYVLILHFYGFVHFAVVLVHVLNLAFLLLLLHFVLLVLSSPPNAEENQTAATKQTQKQRQQNIQKIDSALLTLSH